jgi:putative hydrolase of the HAD superfamily
MARALLLDIGDVLTELPWRSFDQYEARTGRSAPFRGPFDPGNDPYWQRHLAGELTYHEYWKTIAPLCGFADWRDMYRQLNETVPETVFDPHVVQLMRDAKAAGVVLGVLTNEGISVSGQAFFDSREEFKLLDAFVDAASFAAKKPDPEPYIVSAQRLGVEPSEVVFLDDHAECVEGSRDVGMIGVHVDPLDKTPAIDRTRELLGLGEARRGHRLVMEAERIYQAQDLEAMMRLLHPEIVIYWNGVKVAQGIEQARQFHIDRLGFGSASRRDYRLRKTFRAQMGDTICGEWESTATMPDGQVVRSAAGEFWTMRGDQLIEWRAYNHRMEQQ